MKLIDVIALTPPQADPEDWAQILTAVYGADHDFIRTHSDRMQWLRRLTGEEDIWGEVTVLTSREGFLFWRLADLRVLVEGENGRALPKPMRTKDHEQWAMGVVTGEHRKGELAKKWNNPDLYLKAKQLAIQLRRTESNGADIIRTDGLYIVIPYDRNIESPLDEIERHIQSGGWFSWDTETDQDGEDDTQKPNPWDAHLVGLSISIKPGTGWYFPIAHVDTWGELLPENWPAQELISWIVNLYVFATQSGAKALLWNCKYDYSVIANQFHRVPIEIVYAMIEQTEDGMLLAAVCNEPAGLKKQARSRLNLETIDYKRLTRGRPFSEVPLEPAAIYAGQDADWPLRLYPELFRRAHELGVLPIYRREMNIIEYFMRIERRGIKVNLHKLHELRTEYEEKREFAWRQFLRTCERSGIDPQQFVPDSGKKKGEGFNPGSPQQLQGLLYSKAGFSLPVPRRTKTGQPATDEKSLNRLRNSGNAHPVLSALLAWRGAVKMLSSYIEVAIKHQKADGKLHPSFHQVGAQTGRTSADNPAVQTFPMVIRKACEPTDPEGEMAGIDYSGIELRVLACEFNEPRMIKAFVAGRDIHEETVERLGLRKIFPDPKEARTKGKNFNFGKAFGAGPPTLAETGNMPLQQAKEFCDAYDAAYPDYTANLQLRIEQAEEEGLVRNWAGRVRLIPRAVNEKTRALNARLVSNTPVQGGALDIMKWAQEDILPLLREYEPLGIHPFNMVHDELNFERDSACPENIWIDFLQRVRQRMEACNPWPGRISLPTDVERGKTWGDLREVDIELLEAAEAA